MSSSNTQLFEENFKVARQCAREGMVLLKNEDNTLPLAANTAVALGGDGSFNFIKGGGGSADVYSPYTKSLIDGLSEKQQQGKLSVCDDAETVLLTISRHGTEGRDRTAEAGDFYLSEQEIELLEQLSASERVKTIVAILNIPAVIDVKWIDKYSKIKAALIAWLPGMEGGSAVCDLLCGDFTPCGKLTDSFAMEYSDYPSSDNFAQTTNFVSYEEDIFVGYRYFETVPRARERVVYPFGYGLSYTSFEYKNIVFSYTDSDITVSVEVENTGSYSGRETVQLYSRSPEGALPKPSVELRAFAKTRLLSPGESQTLELHFAIESMASFDDTGATGYLAAYVLEGGVYEIFIASDVRSLELCGSLFVEHTVVTSQLSLKLSAIPARKNQSGVLVQNLILGEQDAPPAAIQYKGNDPIMLKDVAEGAASMEQFLAQLSDEELINLLQAQPPTFPRGTAGIGNLKKYGVPNAQTADGPSGLRKSTPTTCFPCSTLVGCTWDEQLQQALGAAIGFEGVSTRVDILLAPGLNIHRDPLCGRNFEYFGEDPLVAGKAAAAVVRGVQSQGMAATIKHFAANNRETNRMDSSSLVSERALREIYLKGFEIAVRESQPCCVMSSYNLINGIHTSENYNLLTGILRDEWGFEGAVMTDWRNHSPQWREIKAGNNIKMPFGYPEQLELTAKMLSLGRLTRGELERAAAPVLRMIMKTDIFRRQDMGVEYTVHAERPTQIKAVEFTGVSATFCAQQPCLDSDGGMNMCEMGKDLRGHDAYLIYDVDIQRGGDYTVQLRIAGAYDSSFLRLTVDNRQLCDMHFTAIECENPWQQWQTLCNDITLPAGRHTLRLIVVSVEREQGININWLRFIPKN